MSFEMNISRSSMKNFSEGDKDKNLDGGSCNSLERERSDWKGMGKAEMWGCGEPLGDDVIDKFPNNPLGVDWARSTLTAIAGWFQELKEESESGCNGLGYGVDEAERKIGDQYHHQLFAEMNCVWGGAIRIQHPGFSELIDEISVPCDGFEGFGVEPKWCDNVKGSMSFSQDDNQVVSNRAQELRGCGENCFDGEGGAPHDAMFFALSYLDVEDLLNVERVCKPFRDTVRSDPLLWRRIHIDQPLSLRIADDALVKLASRAQGSLQCLSLVQCIGITDSGLKRVLESNTRLTKLSVPGCIRLTVEGILNNLRAFKFVGTPGIKQLRIAGVSRITDKQFEELQFLLDADKHIQPSARKPQFYCGGLSCDDDHAIDIEVCPRCLELRLVYDCPAESCQGKHQAAQLCRACKHCIKRCIHCGSCIKDDDYEETFCLDLLCLDCYNQLFNCQEGPGEKVASNCTIFHQETRFSIVGAALRTTITRKHSI